MFGLADVLRQALQDSLGFGLGRAAIVGPNALQFAIGMVGPTNMES